MDLEADKAVIHVVVVVVVVVVVQVLEVEFLTTGEQ